MLNLLILLHSLYRHFLAKTVQKTSICFPLYTSFLNSLGAVDDCRYENTCGFFVFVCDILNLRAYFRCLRAVFRKYVRYFNFACEFPYFWVTLPKYTVHFFNPNSFTRNMLVFCGFMLVFGLFVIEFPTLCSVFRLLCSIFRIYARFTISTQFPVINHAHPSKNN